MLRYQLDNLGWSDFERMMQGLLKVKLGLGIEAWGGTGDFGRDAYFHGRLHYPLPDSDGEFVFQAKFVEAANAAGARPYSPLRNAVAKEVNRIKKRIANDEIAPTHYIFFTNAICGRETRKVIHELLLDVFKEPETSIHIHDGNDICSWLDSSPELAKSFPTILGFRNLSELLIDRIDKAILERSRSAISGAEDLARVFVPTKSYYKALNSVAKQNFVVLSGAPEAGKTAIGKMISLAQLAHGWEIIECRDPEDLLKTYDSRYPQCFFADDFFGRTEFDPMRARRWENDLPVVLKKLNDQHWLILTSRAHILHQGERAIDVDSEIHFPDASEIVVDATSLDREERARILYRHAKYNNLGVGIKGNLKLAAWNIVEMPTFTAERVRRFMNEISKEDIASTSMIEEFAKSSFNNPTERSQKTFRALPESHKWYLFSKLENDDSSNKNPEDRFQNYELLCPEPFCVPGERVEADLIDSFLSSQSKQWSHPSYRDVAIDELIVVPKYRNHFLSNCGTNGIKLAISWLGGATGARSLPLLKSDEDWSALRSRAEFLANKGFDVLTILVTSLTAGVAHKWLSESDENRLRSVIDSVRLVSTAHNKAESGRFEALETFLKVDDGEGIPVDWDLIISTWTEKANSHLLENYVPWQLLPGIYFLKKYVDLAKTYNIDVCAKLVSNSELEQFYVTMLKKLEYENLEWDGYEFKTRNDAEDAASEYRGQYDDLDFYIKLAINLKKISYAKRLLAIHPIFNEQGDSLSSYAEHLSNDEEERDYDGDDGRRGHSSDYGRVDVHNLFCDL